jgi:predicted small metal-binding protein
VEAKVDFSDVRSGLRESCGVNLAFEVCPLESDALWTKDMVWLLDADCLSPGAPSEDRRECAPPTITTEASRVLESKIVAFLLRHFTRTLYRNFTLSLYSDPSESRADFGARCADLLCEQFRAELDQHREVFERKLEHIKERHLGTDIDVEFDKARLRSQIGSRIHETAEKVTNLFLQASLFQDRSWPPLGHPDQRLPELEQKLQTIEMEACQAIERIRAVFLEKARSSDEYLVRPTLRDIHLGRLGFVWMPVAGVP